MEISVALPVTVYVDNIGAIFMTSNPVTTTSRTKHVDIRGKYVAEYQQNGMVKIIFVKSEDNIAGIMTKNLGSDLHTKNAEKLIGKME